MIQTAKSFTGDDRTEFMYAAETIRELRFLKKTLLSYPPDDQRDAVRLLHDMTEHVWEDTSGLRVPIGTGETVWFYGNELDDSDDESQDGGSHDESHDNESQGGSQDDGSQDESHDEADDLSIAAGDLLSPPATPGP